MTDYVPACQEFSGTIVNATINKHVYATVCPRRDRKIVLYAPDHDDLQVEIRSTQHLDPHGQLGLAQEILRRFELPAGLELTTYSLIPALGSGCLPAASRTGLRKASGIRCAVASLRHLRK